MLGAKDIAVSNVAKNDDRSLPSMLVFERSRSLELPALGQPGELVMWQGGVIGGLMLLMAGSGTAMAQAIADMKGTWVLSQSANLADGPVPHSRSGTSAVAGHDSYRRHVGTFTLRVDGQDGRTFWGVKSTSQHSERLIGAISVDGKRIVMVDEDGQHDATFVDADTLDYCYRHVTAASRVVACGLMTRRK